MSTDPTPTTLDLEAIETALHTPGLDSWHTILTSIPALIAEVRRLRTESPAPNPDTLISVTASGWHVGSKAHIACLACGAHLTEEREGMRLPTGLYVGTAWPTHGLPAPALTSEVREALEVAIPLLRSMGYPARADQLDKFASTLGSAPPAPLTEGARVKELEGLLRRGQKEMVWCSGSGDFAPEGQARIGWLKGPAQWLHDVTEALSTRREVEDGPRPGGGEAKTPWGDAASGWDSNQAAQALSNRLWEADSLIRANIGFLAAEADLIGIPASKRAWLWQAKDYAKKREQDEKATERPAPGASPVPPVTPGIPGEGERV